MYKVVIGLEVHCELTTISKNFSGSENSYSEEPNSHVATVDLGFPGVLPVVNEEAVKKALKVALALNCETPKELVFERKNYFYPDLPKGYQITQERHAQPVGINGYVMINVNGEDKKVLINNTHLEEDTASLDHFSAYSLIDYNRSGVPLLETVTEPCMHSADEAVTFLEALRAIFLYTETSEARSDRGELRCDVNISLMKENDTEFGTKVEMKNINSFNNVREAIEYEIKRQTEVLEKGGTVLQETRRYDDEDCCTYVMRSKVDAVDYKHFIEPNIPPVKISDDFINSIKKELPKLQYERSNIYINDYELSRYDATILVKEKETAEYFEKCIELGGKPKLISNWITTNLLGYLNKEELTLNDIYLTPEKLVEMTKLIENKEISSKQAKEVFAACLKEDKTPKEIVKEKGLSQISDSSAIIKVVAEVLDENEEMVEKYKAGRTNVADFLVGQVMKKTRGQANPSMARETIISEIEKR